MIYGYARVSTRSQLNGNSLEDQRKSLLGAGAEVVIDEQFSGSTVHRPEFEKLLTKLKEGDTLMVTKLDRLSRSTQEGLELVQDLKSKKIKVHVLNMGVIDDSSIGNLILTIMLAFAEYERTMINERMAEGKEYAKSTNPDFREGRPFLEIPQLEMYQQLVEEGAITVKQACYELGISHMTWYRRLKS